MKLKEKKKILELWSGIQLHIGGKNVKSGMESLHRLLVYQWSSISKFNQIILNVCQQKLQEVDIDVQVACSCLVSIYLLDTKSMVELLNTLIGLHSSGSLKSTLHFDLCGALGAENGGLVVQKLNELYKNDSEPMINLVHFSNASALKFLPPTIINYRLTPSKDVQGLGKDDITKCVYDWSMWVKSYTEENVRSLLLNITKIKGLHEIREEAFKIDTPKEWPIICSSLSMPDIHVWCHYFQPLLTARVKDIIDDRWTQIYNIWNVQFLQDLAIVTSEDTIEKEVDINWYVWKDLIGETVIETRDEVISVMSSLMKDMWLQDHGFTKTLEKLCQSMDIELQKSLDDLAVYIINDREIKNKEGFYVYEEDDKSNEMYRDKDEIQGYLRDITAKKMQSIMEFIKHCFDDTKLQSTELQCKTTVIYAARFTQALIHLVPNLRKCFVPECNDLGKFESDTESIRCWNNFCDNLKAICLYCWGKWVDIAMSKVQNLTSGLPQEFTLEANIDYLMMQWDVIKIEEKDDEGKSVESIIKVPSGPSLKLQEYLYSVSRILDEVVPHTLPSEVHAIFIEKVSDIAFNHFGQVIREHESDINQRCALQLLMDVRHLTLLLVPRENKKTMDQSHDICEFLRQKIDPFDYDVFYPYIQTNLKRSVQRVQTLLGSLIIHHGQVNLIVGNRPVLSGGTADKSPALLAPASPDGGHWFTLLPVTAPLTMHKKTEKTKKKPVTAASPNKPTKSELSELMTSSLPINLATARSGAASFFNDWFSGA
ncbi:Conserved oligomeric Golgi complex subunit 1 [Eumeta japonica]|uniref:Conserved oligomeric Golgi complex subunit 1 n=1 Tax=Eumeta variegata TaxID=151549 RepID=A0A4C1VT35_EUMVA|nr:Conserved oligomeric Golgi complex subunit 1 [Eumeta japonica]